MGKYPYDCSLTHAYHAHAHIHKQYFKDLADLLININQQY